jgi:hypothetical protein
VPRRCWRLNPPSLSFDWGLAFSRLHRKGRPPLNRFHVDVVYRVLQGLVMENRPVGGWGRPTCGACGAHPVDTAHCLFCVHHGEAFRWLWEVAQSLAPNDYIDRNNGVLLGGCSPLRLFIVF